MLVADQGGGVLRCGVDAVEAGDRHLQTEVRAMQEADGALHDPAQTLARMRPRLQGLRAHMNLDPGYGVVSITPTPDRFIRNGFLSVEPGTRALFASDGFMRLIDVFNRYTPDSLMSTASTRGLRELLSELREIERADLSGAAHPRVKANDDASAMLVEIGAAPQP
jgi:hypothetical protein